MILSSRKTKQDEIRKVMDAYMKDPGKQRAPFLVSIFSREHRQGGIIYEGARPISAVSSFDEEGKESDRVYTISNGDSGYTTAIATLKLSGIEYIETLGK